MACAPETGWLWRTRRALRDERKLLQVLLDSLDVAVGRQLRHVLTCRHAGRLGWLVSSLRGQGDCLSASLSLAFDAARENRK
jgi:hypothetical protein